MLLDVLDAEAANSGDLVRITHKGSLLYYPGLNHCWQAGS